MSLSPGARIGPYDVLSPLGEGGMGAVFLARDTRLDRTVAIKSVKDDPNGDPERRARVEREGRIIAKLSHPRICTLHDIVQEEHETFLVMEALDGETLAARLLRLGGKGLPVAQCLTIAAELADALAFAHQQGVVHQDVKPANVMLTRTGVKLMDFGIARLRRAREPGVTTTGPLDEMARAGTLPYMAPEQLDGRADARSDIFALGAVIFEMLTGERAFAGTTSSQILARILEHDPPVLPRAVAPPSVARVVQKCLAKDPQARWQTAADLAEVLRWSARDLEEPSTPVAATRAASRIAKVATVSAAAVAALLLAIVVSRPATPTPAQPVALVVGAPQGTTLSAFGWGGAPAISPDGTQLAFVASRIDGTDLLFIRSLGQVDAKVLPGTEGAAEPFWSPDGRQVAFFSDGQLKRIPAEGGAVQTIAQSVDASGGGTWNRAGTIVVASGDGRLLRLSVDGGAASSVGARPVAGQRTASPVFLPDDRHFLYWSSAPGTQAGIFIGSLDADEGAFLAPADSGAVFSTGRLLFVRGVDLLGQPFDATRRSLSGEPSVVVKGLWSGGGRRFYFTASPNGALAALTGGQAADRLVWLDRQGRRVEVVTGDGTYQNPAVSPDGTRIAVNMFDPVSGTLDLWLIEPARGVTSRLARSVSSGRWLSDGRRLVYSLRPAYTPVVHDLATSATVPVPLPQGPDAFLAVARDPSPDGASLVVYRPRAPGELWLLPTTSSGAPARRLVPGPGTEARFSPDGRWVAYSSDAAGRFEIFLMSTTGRETAVQVSNAGGMEPVWRRDGKELFYLSYERTLMAVEVGGGSPLRLSPARPLFDMPTSDLSEMAVHYDAAADGQRFLVAEERPAAVPLGITVITNWTTAAR